MYKNLGYLWESSLFLSLDQRQTKLEKTQTWREFSFFFTKIKDDSP